VDKIQRFDVAAVSTNYYIGPSLIL